MYGIEMLMVLEVFTEMDETRFNDLDIYFSGTYYASIHGKIPYNLAKLLLKKYPKYIHDIRINGGAGGFLDNRKYYKKDDLGNEYIGCYHIDSKEGLIYFLSEYNYYYDKIIYTQKLRKNLYHFQKKVLAEVNRRLLEIGNPKITTEMWLKAHDMKEIENVNVSQDLFSCVKEFDSIVNPFSNKACLMKHPSNYIDDVILSIASDYNNYFKMTITNDNGQIDHVRDTRGKDDYIAYRIFYDVNENTIMEVNHYISYNEKENVICIYRFNRDYSNSGKIDLRYDFLSGKAYSTYGSKNKITIKEKELLIYEMKKAINQVKKITVKNMVQKQQCYC